MRVPPSLKRSLGFGLLEVILVFVLVLGAGAIVFQVFASASVSRDVDNETEKMLTLIGNMHTVYGNKPDFAGVNALKVIQAKAAPASMINSAGTGLISPWGQITINVGGGAGHMGGACQRLNSCFYLTYYAVPSEVCVKLVPSLARHLPSIGVGTIWMVENGKIHADLIGMCSQHPTMNISFYGA